MTENLRLQWVKTPSNARAWIGSIFVHVHRFDYPGWYLTCRYLNIGGYVLLSDLEASLHLAEKVLEEKATTLAGQLELLLDQLKDKDRE